MKVAIMQPYFFPYLGYFQLISLADTFVVYDNIQYTKKGWINRNRFLQNGSDAYFTLPLKKDSDFLNIDRRFLADGFEKHAQSMHNVFSNAYRKAPFFQENLPLLDHVLSHPGRNLFEFIFASIQQVCTWLNISTQLVPSSQIPADHTLKSEDRVIAICNALGATHYINPSGGQALYHPARFLENGISLQIHRMNAVEYAQFDGNFVPFLSIVDVLMFNGKARTQPLLREFTLTEPT